MQPTTEFAAIQGIKVPPAVFSDHETFIEATRKGLSGKIVKQAVDALGHRDLFLPAHKMGFERWRSYPLTISISQPRQLMSSEPAKIFRGSSTMVIFVQNSDFSLARAKVSLLSILFGICAEESEEIRILQGQFDVGPKDFKMPSI